MQDNPQNSFEDRLFGEPGNDAMEEPEPGGIVVRVCIGKGDCSLVLDLS